MKTTKLPSAPPMEADDVAIVTGGTVLWLVGFVALLPFHGWLSAHGDTRWLWTCLAGFVLGLIGIWYCRARRDAIARSRAAAANLPGAASNVPGAASDRHGAAADVPGEAQTPSA